MCFSTFMSFCLFLLILSVYSLVSLPSWILLYLSFLCLCEHERKKREKERQGTWVFCRLVWLLNHEKVEKEKERVIERRKRGVWNEKFDPRSLSLSLFFILLDLCVHACVYIQDKEPSLVLIVKSWKQRKRNGEMKRYILRYRGKGCLEWSLTQDPSSSFPFLDLMFLHVFERETKQKDHDSWEER